MKIFCFFDLLTKFLANTIFCYPYIELYWFPTFHEKKITVYTLIYAISLLYFFCRFVNGHLRKYVYVLLYAVFSNTIERYLYNGVTNMFFLEFSQKTIYFNVADILIIVTTIILLLKTIKNKI